MNVAMLLSCGSFEGFFGGVLGQSRQSYLERYRNDWSWYYARGLLENGINPNLYIPALYEAGKYETDAGFPVRFLPLDRWYRPFDQVWLKRLSRQTRWSLYAEERIKLIRSPLWGLFEKRLLKMVLIFCIYKNTGAVGSTISYTELVCRSRALITAACRKV
jgi:hypothetical protein